MSIEIIPFAPKYAPIFDRLNRAWIEEFFHVEPFDHQVLSDPETHIIATGGEIWFARHGGQVVGTSALLPLAEGMLEFTKLGVEPAARGIGVARALVRHTACRARARGAHTLRIFSNRQLVPACSLYLSEGFVETPMTAEQKERYQRADIILDLAL